MRYYDVVGVLIVSWWVVDWCYWSLDCGLWIVDSWNGLCVVGVWCVGMILTNISTTLFFDKWDEILWCCGDLGCGLWVVDWCYWILDCGLWIVGCGLWIVDCGFLSNSLCCGCMVCWNILTNISTTLFFDKWDEILWCYWSLGCGLWIIGMEYWI